MCIKYMLEHYKDNDITKYYNVYYHFLHSFFNNNVEYSFFNNQFNYNTYIEDSETNFKNKNNSELLVQYHNDLVKIIFDNEINSKNEFYNTIFNKTFEKNPDLLKFFDFDNNINSNTFGKYMEHMIENKIQNYIANSFYNNIELLRYGYNINVSKPTYYSLHQIKLGKNGVLNHVIMNTVFNENNKKKEENNVISKNKLNKLIENVKREIYDSNRLQVEIKEINKKIHNSEPLQKKIQEIYLFEILLILLYKRYSKSIDNEIIRLISNEINIELNEEKKMNFVKEYLPIV